MRQMLVGQIGSQADKLANVLGQDKLRALLEGCPGLAIDLLFDGRLVKT
jgi:hypothetical protein